MKKNTKIILILICLALIIILIPVFSFLYNKYIFLNTLENHGYSKSTEGNFYIAYDENQVLSKITIEKYNFFGIPDFQFEYFWPLVSIKFNNIKDDTQNIIYLLDAPTNISTGKPLTIDELPSLLDINNTKSFILNGTEVTKDEWLSASKNYIAHIETKYNEIKSMFE